VSDGRAWACTEAPRLEGRHKPRTKEGSLQKFSPGVPPPACGILEPRRFNKRAHCRPQWEPARRKLLALLAALGRASTWLAGSPLANTIDRSPPFSLLLEAGGFPQTTRFF